MASVLLRLEMLSHGSTQAWNASGGHSGEPDDRVLTLVLSADEPPHLRWRRIYRTAITIDGRLRIIDEAQQELRFWTRRTVPQVENTKSLVDLILEDGEGYEPAVVARRFGVDVAYVRRQRARAQRGTEDGRELHADEPADRVSKARELRGAGLSTRQIAVILDCHQTQVMRWIRKSSAGTV